MDHCFGASRDGDAGLEWCESISGSVRDLAAWAFAYQASKCFSHSHRAQAAVFLGEGYQLGPGEKLRDGCWRLAPSQQVDQEPQLLQDLVPVRCRVVSVLQMLRANTGGACC